MSIPISITTQEFKEAKKLLKTEKEIICLDKPSHVRYLLVARDMLIRGQDVKAQILKGY